MMNNHHQKVLKNQISDEKNLFIFFIYILTQQTICRLQYRTFSKGEGVISLKNDPSAKIIIILHNTKIAPNTFNLIRFLRVNTGYPLELKKMANMFNH